MPTPPPPPVLLKPPIPKPMLTGLPPLLAAGVYSMVCASSKAPLGITICARSTRRPPPSISTRSRSPTIV